MLHLVGNIFEYYYDARTHERYKYICFFEIIAEKRVAFITYHLCRVSGLSCLKPLGYNENAEKGSIKNPQGSCCLTSRYSFMTNRILSH